MANFLVANQSLFGKDKWEECEKMKAGFQTSLNQVLAPVEKDLQGTDLVLWREKDRIVILVQLKTGRYLDIDPLPLEEQRGAFNYSGKLKGREKKGMRQYAQELIQSGKAEGAKKKLKQLLPDGVDHIVPSFDAN